MGSELDSIRAAAFRSLLRSGSPVSVARLAEETGTDAGGAEEAVAELARQGGLVRNAAGEVVGAAGLSVAPTRHQIDVEGRRRWTWCALDAVGILGALGRGGRISSRSPTTDAPVEVRFEGGRPQPNDAVLFIAERGGTRSVVDEWCPLVNFFESAEAAEEWARRTGALGRIVSVEEATSMGAPMWRSLVVGDE